jgi:hypothetical protein
MRRAALVWKARQAGSPAPGAAALEGQVSATDMAAFQAEIRELQRAAMHGDVSALNRLIGFGQTMATLSGGSMEMPNPADIIAAQRGDPAAIARLRARHEVRPQLQTTGLQAQSMVSFHPPLKRRLKRLDRMGAHVDVTGRKMSTGAIIFMAVLGTVIGSLLLAAGVMMLVVIAMIIMLNLIVLGLWLMAIQGILHLLLPR